MRGKPIGGIGSSGKPTPRSIAYGKWMSPASVEDADVDDLGVEDLLDLVADDVVDRLQFELSGDRLLDAVDQRELGVPLAVSWTRRAFSSATLRLPARVVSSRWSAS